jgi:hypothetical protein
LSHSIIPIFVMGFFKIGCLKHFVQVGSCSLSPE